MNMKTGVSDFHLPADPEDLFDWDRLRIFRMVAHLGSMSAAANQLQTSLPTISRRVSELEALLSANLIRRSPKGIELTETGLRVRRHADVMADVVHAIHMEIDEAGQSTSGPVRIICCEAVGPYWLATHLAGLSMEYPAMSPNLIVSDMPSEGLIWPCDLTIQVRRPTNPNLIIRRLGRVHYRFFAPKMIARSKPPQSLKDLKGRTCLAPEDYASMQLQESSLIAPYHSLLGDAVTSNSIATLAAICKAGGGIAILPAFISEHIPDLEPIDTLYPPPLDLWLAYPDRLRHQKRGKILLNWVNDVFDPSTYSWFQESPEGRRPTPVRPSRKRPRKR